MKNNLFIFFLLNFLISNISFAEQFTFKSSEIELIDGGNLIYATNGSAISTDENLQIQAKNFEYSKIKNELKAFNGTAFYKINNLEIEFDKLTTNQNTLISVAEGNVKIFDLNNQLIIRTETISLDQNNNILESKSKSQLTDKANGNVLDADEFLFNTDKDLIKLKNANLKDFQKNNYQIEIAYINTKSKKLIGKDVIVDLNNTSFNVNNDPRIKGRSIVYENKLTKISKGVFTTCKKSDKCPPWQLSAEKVQHDPEKQIINYNNAILKVYDVPVMYFPKFFHPDPTVKRKSGFLMPTLNNSPNADSFISVPYYSVISQNKDMTFTPRFYPEDKFLIQTEYRQENKSSSHFSDLSLLGEKDQSSKSHFFYRYNKFLNFSYFEDGILNFKVEKTSNDTYLRKSNLVSPLIENYNVLENIIGLDLYSEDLSITSELKVFEDLDEEKTSDKYEFILPKIDFVKRIENKTSLEGNFLLKSNNFIRNYATNIMEKININNLIFNSTPRITNLGFNNNYEFIIKNVNSDSSNSNNYENEENFYVSGLFQYNSSLPLVKEKKNMLNILKPKLALKLSPNHTKDLSKNDGKRLDVNNIYNIDRLSSNDTVEGGASLTYGNDFIIFDKNRSSELLSIKLANNLRLEENNDLPKNNQLGSKTSNFFSEIAFTPNEIFSTKYSSSLQNNLTEINYENFIAEISINKFVTTFDYLNENNSSNKNSFLTNTTKFNLDDSNSLKFSTRENKTSDLTEYYNLMYEYKNDCLAASIEYNKNYYDDRDIKPEENIFLKLTIIPFGETSSPNLKD